MVDLGVGWATVCELARGLTVEPVVLLYVLQALVASLTTQNALLAKACLVDLGRDAAECAAPPPALAQAQQQLLSQLFSWLALVRTLLPATIVLWLGALSDATHARKPFLLLPLIGDLVGYVGLLVAWSRPGWGLEATALAATLPGALSGGGPTLIMAAFSYIGDVSTAETRTLRIGLVNALLSLGTPVGSALAGVLYQRVGLRHVYHVAIAINLVGIVWLLLAVPESRGSPTPADQPASARPTSTWKAHVHPRLLWTTLALAWRRRPGRRKPAILTATLLSVTLFLPLHGEGVVAYLYVIERLGWNELQFGFYLAFSSVVTLVGMVVTLALLVRALRLHDCQVALLAAAAKLLASFAFAFANTPTYFYLATLLELLNGALGVVLRSLYSKLVEPAELGRANSLLALCSEGVSPLLAQPAYSQLYSVTVAYLPGAVFFLSAALCAANLAALGLLYRLVLRVAPTETEDEGAAAAGTDNPAFESAPDSQTDTRL